MLTVPITTRAILTVKNSNLTLLYSTFVRISVSFVLTVHAVSISVIRDEHWSVLKLPISTRNFLDTDRFLFTQASTSIILWVLFSSYFLFHLGRNFDDYPGFQLFFYAGQTFCTRVYMTVSYNRILRVKDCSKITGAK